MMNIIGDCMLNPSRYSELDNGKITSEFLRMCKVNSIDDLQDKDCCLLYDILFPRIYPTVGTYYEAMRTKKVCAQFIKDVRNCLKLGKLRIVVHELCNEGVVDETKSLESQIPPYEYVVI